MKVVEAVKADLRTDVTWNRVGRLTVKGARALPSTSLQYLLDKVPIVGWLPRYSPQWIFNDVIAGLTLGLMLIPQGLSYASLATIGVEYGLMSSWFPSALYAFMGTTKGEAVVRLHGSMSVMSDGKTHQTCLPGQLHSLVSLLRILSYPSARIHRTNHKKLRRPSP